MILATETIYLAPLKNTLRVLPEVGYLDHAQGEALFGAQAAAFEQAVSDFAQHVCDNEERENEVRRALCFVLNLDDTALLETTRALDMPFPNACAADQRRYLSMLWAGAFSSWRVDDFDASEYKVDRQDER